MRRGLLDPVIRVLRVLLLVVDFMSCSVRVLRLLLCVVRLYVVDVRCKVGGCLYLLWYCFSFIY